ARDVDDQASNTPRGLRLAESLLTGETKQRIVLVSDGRTNAGDLQAELERLRALGVVVDVHTVEVAQSADAAVAGIDVPTGVNEGESFTATVEVVSTIAGSAVVELRDEGGTIETRQVDLEAGTNRFDFEVVAGEPGLQKLEASVRMTGDAVAANNTSSGAVQVSGPPGVLVVEGQPGNGSVLAGVLESAGIEVSVVDVGDLGGVDELSAHQSVILVDVRARDLSQSHLPAPSYQPIRPHPARQLCPEPGTRPGGGRRHPLLRPRRLPRRALGGPAPGRQRSARRPAGGRGRPGASQRPQRIHGGLPLLRRGPVHGPSRRCGQD